MKINYVSKVLNFVLKFINMHNLFAMKSAWVQVKFSFSVLPVVLV